MRLDDVALKTLSLQAVDAAKAAGAFIQSNLGKKYNTESKGSHLTLASQVVTEIDIRAQAIIIEQLQPGISEFDLGLLTEESTDNESRFTKDYFWCVDPMDGTLAFTEGKSGYAVSIALVSRDGNPVVGAVYIPDLDECYSATQGQGVFLNGRSFDRKKLSDSKKINLFMDRSFPSEKYFQQVLDQLEKWSAAHGYVDLSLHIGHGAVRNALAVLTSANACYFKFPKPTDGGGSIWDFAATRLFFEELEMPVGTFEGKTLPLNDPHSTFMNRSGVFYATSNALTDEIRSIRSSLGR